MRKKRTPTSREDRVRAAAARAIQREFYAMDPNGKSTKAKWEIGQKLGVDATTIHKWVHGDIRPGFRKALEILRSHDPGNPLLKEPPKPGPQPKQLDLNIGERLALEAHARIDNLQNQVEFLTQGLETAAGILKRWATILKIDEPENQKKEKQNELETH